MVWLNNQILYKKLKNIFVSINVINYNMDVIKVEQSIIGLTYDKTIEFFKKFIGNDKLYFRPIQIDNLILYRDNTNDCLRCNLIFTNGVVAKIDGWY